MCVVVLCTSCASSKKVVYLQDVVPLKQQDIEQKYEVYVQIGRASCRERVLTSV